MEDKFKPLESEFKDKDSVLSFSSGLSMFKVNEVASAVKQAFNDKGLEALKTRFSSRGGIPGNWQQWIVQGVECEMLKPGSKGWLKGKLRIKFSLEFCPDESDVEETLASNHPEINQSESPLDDIRQMMNQDS